MRSVSLYCTRLLLAVAGSVLVTSAAAAQESEGAPVAAPFGTWRVSIAGGALAEPVSNGGAGGALSVDIARRLGRSRASLSALVVAAQRSDIGRFGPSQLTYDRDWRIVALGIEATAKNALRFDLAFGIYGSAVWSRGRPVGQGGAGEPPPTWDEGAALIPTMGVAYRLRGPFALNARLAVIQRVGQDNFFGDVGGLLTVGAAIAW
jgi:hypothetical protein